LPGLPEPQDLIDSPTSAICDPLIGGRAPISRAMYLSWLAVPELQSRFDLGDAAGRNGLARWCRQNGSGARGLRARTRKAWEWFRAIPPSYSSDLPGCNLVGYSRGVLGMGEHVRMTAHAMQEAGIPFDVVDFSLGLGKTRQDSGLARHLSGSARRRCTIMHVNADQMVRALWHYGPRFFASRYIVGYWAWELPLLPEVWRPVLGLVDEVWAPSEFIRAAIQPFTSKPVVHMPLCVELPPFKRLPRHAFGWKDTDFVFGFAFDCHSWLSRKNPAAIVKAFNAAFNEGETARLVLKAMHAQESDPHWRALVELVADDPRITLINEVWTRERLLAFMAAIDAYVSLHRSEGFGRSPAEAMLLGKPVIVTGYSGTEDFCRNDNSLLVGFDLVAVADGDYPHSQRQSWAEPNCHEASRQMRRLFEDRDLAAEIGKNGRKTIEEEFCGHATGRRYRARLEEIGMLNEQEQK